MHEIGEVGNQIYLSMAYTLGNKCAKNQCKRIVLLQLIIENVVTCFFFGTQCIIEKWISICYPAVNKWWVSVVYPGCFKGDWLQSE